MSSSALPRTSAPVNPMRQQLDELDALLQRMLSLPVNQLKESGGDPSSGALPAPVGKAHLPIAPSVERPSVSQIATVEKPRTPSPRTDREEPPSARSESRPRVQGTMTVFQPLSSPGTLTVVTPRVVAQRPELESKPLSSAAAEFGGEGSAGAQELNANPGQG